MSTKSVDRERAEHSVIVNARTDAAKTLRHYVALYRLARFENDKPTSRHWLCCIVAQIRIVNAIRAIPERDVPSFFRRPVTLRVALGLKDYV